MKIIDFEQKGNVIRFYLGKDDCFDYYGDDWNDAPYDSNAGLVYEQFISGYVDLAFPFDYIVLQPCDNYYGHDCHFTKNDMKSRVTPCIIAVPYSVHQSCWSARTFDDWVGSDQIVKYYMGDKMDVEKGAVPFELARALE